MSYLLLTLCQVYRGQRFSHYITATILIMLDKLSGAQGFTWPGQAAGGGQLPNDVLRGCAAGAQKLQASTLLTLGQTLTGAIQVEGDMGKGRHGKSQGFKEQDLARSRSQQVGATYHLVDAHKSIVDDDGKLIGKDAVGSAQNKISHHMLNMLATLTSQQVVKGDHALSGNTQA
jgi:hypothetical protein